jgi:hypothetical protein
MAMMREQRNTEMRQRMEAMEHERRRVEELARSLSQQATVEWRKALEGMVALPAAITVGLAASTLSFVGFVTRTLEIFQTQAIEMSERMRELDGGDRAAERSGERGERGRPEMPTA